MERKDVDALFEQILDTGGLSADMLGHSKRLKTILMRERENLQVAAKRQMKIRLMDLAAGEKRETRRSPTWKSGRKIILTLSWAEKRLKT